MSGAFTALLRKDFLYELRTGQTVVVALSFALLLGTLTAFGIQNAFLEPVVRERLMAPLCWVLFLVTASIVFGRAFHFERASGAIEGVVVSGASLVTFFLSKCVVFYLISILLHTSLVLVLSFLSQSEALFSSEFVLLSAMVLFAYVPLVVLLLALSFTSRLGAVLLPLLSLPLLFPLFFAATELTQVLVTEGELNFSSFWFALVLSLDIFYLLCGLALFPPVIRD